jgi:hypothetical protein
VARRLQAALSKPREGLDGEPWHDEHVGSRWRRLGLGNGGGGGGDEGDERVCSRRRAAAVRPAGAP